MNESKAYVATLPASISRDVLAKLSAWGQRNCWKSAVDTRSAPAMWIAVREKSRTKDECVRHVAQVLQAIGDVRTPTGEWLRLVRVQEAERLIERSRRKPTPAAAATETTIDDDTKIVDLSLGVSRGARGRGAARRYEKISVTKE